MASKHPALKRDHWPDSDTVGEKLISEAAPELVPVGVPTEPKISPPESLFWESVFPESV